VVKRVGQRDGLKTIGREVGRGEYANDLESQRFIIDQLLSHLELWMESI